MNRRLGFTLIELIVVVVVIAILVSISTFGFIAIQAQSRDTERAANATVIAEALEKYYDQNGEYPGCNALTGDASTVRSSTLKGIDESVLLTPNAPTTVTNTIQCTNVEPSGDNDYFAYVADTSNECQSGSACAYWTLKYQEEETDSVGEIDSRRQASAFAVPSPTGLTITASLVGSTTARGIAGGGNCSGSSVIERQLRYRATNTSATGTWSAWVSASQQDLPADQGYKYSFEQRARCTVSVTSSNWASSAVGAVVRPITTLPAAVTVSVTPSTTVLLFSRTSATCPTGTTARYQYKYLADWNYESTWYGPSTASTYNWTAASEGYEYKINIQAHCYTVHSTGGWGGTGGVSYIRPVLPPDGLPSNFSHTVAGDRLSRSFAWTAPTCNTGAQAQYHYNSYIGNSSMYWVATGQPGWLYGNGGWSATGYWTASTNSPMESGTVPYGTPVQHRVQYICTNPTTGRSSSWGTAVSSPMFNT